MRLKFWGVRGSIPCPPSQEEFRGKIKSILEQWVAAQPNCRDEHDLDRFLDSLPKGQASFVGGNTPCLSIDFGQEILVFDAGTGLKNLGQYLVPNHISELLELFYLTEKIGALGFDIGGKYWPTHRLHLFMTHTHWDHIQGFPFFRPAYAPNYIIDIYGANKEAVKTALLTQQTSPSLFPVPMDAYRATIDFKDFPRQGQKIGDLFIEALPLPHPGASLAYRIKSPTKTVVFATDYEIQTLELEGGASLIGLIDFIAQADIFISDAQYTYLEHATKTGWGHSNALSVVEIASKAGVKNLYLFHHDPNYSDEKLLDILDKARAYAKLIQNGSEMGVFLATEGLTIQI
ncbi:MAG: MBL fold metallo-hydrolase [Deltaproteobacteria bacterium]|jgi:phosphoribosyl 1,2-cyclic phosphodiesterase|nr:MBL fold metallo-hydrolase [Deltaproteobacteria bacterium]